MKPILQTIVHGIHFYIQSGTELHYLLINEATLWVRGKERERFKTHILERITIIIIPFRLKQFWRNFLKENFLCGTLVNPSKEIQIRKKQFIKTLLGSVESSARSILLLSLSSCGPGFESQAHAIYYTFHVTYWIYVVFWL